MATDNYVSHKELAEAQDRTKDDIMDHIDNHEKNIERLDVKVQRIDEKVGHLNDLVLPLTVSMRQTAENTKEISESLKEFTKSQSATNGIFYDKFNKTAVEMENLKTVTTGLGEKKKYNATIVVAIISLIGIFITGMFQLAPLFFEK